jgi:hypothetical protein
MWNAKREVIWKCERLRIVQCLVQIDSLSGLFKSHLIKHFPSPDSFAERHLAAKRLSDGDIISDVRVVRLDNHRDLPNGDSHLDIPAKHVTEFF